MEKIKRETKKHHQNKEIEEKENKKLWTLLMTPKKRTSQTDFFAFPFHFYSESTKLLLKKLLYSSSCGPFFYSAWTMHFQWPSILFSLSHCNPFLMLNRVNWPKSGKNSLIFWNVFMKSEPSHKVATLFNK